MFEQLDELESHDCELSWPLVSYVLLLEDYGA